jgi:hypothetical protein
MAGDTAMSSRPIILALWALIVLLLVGSHLLSFVDRSRFASVHDLVGHLTNRTWKLVAAFLGWMWVGWHFFVR